MRRPWAKILMEEVHQHPDVWRLRLVTDRDPVGAVISSGVIKRARARNVACAWARRLGEIEVEEVLELV